MTSTEAPKAPWWKGALRIAMGYLIGCLLAGLWVNAYVGGASFMAFNSETSQQIEPTYTDHLRAIAFFVMIALLGCLIPVAIGRGVMLLYRTTAPYWFALIWASAGALIAGGNPLEWINNLGELVPGFILPGAIIGLAVWKVEGWGQS